MHTLDKQAGDDGRRDATMMPSIIHVLPPAKSTLMLPFSAAVAGHYHYHSEFSQDKTMQKADSDDGLVDLR